MRVMQRQFRQLSYVGLDINFIRIRSMIVHDSIYRITQSNHNYDLR